MLVLPQPAVDLDQEAINVLTIAEIWGMIARFLNRNLLDLFPRDAKVLPVWTDRLCPATARETTREEYQDVPHVDGSYATVAGRSHLSPRR